MKSRIYRITDRLPFVRNLSTFRLYERFHLCAAQYSGYLNATDGTRLHYWFAVASEGNWKTKPVVLWLNGGPGSSSLLGWLQELGPLLINHAGGLMENPYAWTKQANFIALESPAGVGYSYCTAYPNCTNDDASTALDARVALQDFFTSKFPELASNEFYITSESYGGVYGPTLAKEILDHAPDINIQGLAVGDPCTDYPSQKQSMDMLWYAHKHGLVPDDDFDLLYNTCGHRVPSFLSRNKWIRKENKWIQERRLSSENETCALARRKFLATTSKGISQSWDLSYVNELDIQADAAALDWDLPGTLNNYQAVYLRRDDVKAALHVEESPSHTWPGPPDGWSYTSIYNACNDAPQNKSMIDIYREIAPKLKNTVVFNGDSDPCVSYEGTRNAIQSVGFDVVDGGSYRYVYVE